jgi:hypothetical protein
MIVVVVVVMDRHDEIEWLQRKKKVLLLHHQNWILMVLELQTLTPRSSLLLKMTTTMAMVSRIQVMDRQDDEIEWLQTKKKKKVLLHNRLS